MECTIQNNSSFKTRVSTPTTPEDFQGGKMNTMFSLYNSGIKNLFSDGKRSFG